MIPSLDLERVIFIVGSGRCGTTLLAELLDAPPDVTSFFELQSLALFLRRLMAGEPLTAEDLEVDAANCAFALTPEAEYNWRLMPDEADAIRGHLLPGLERRSVAPSAVRAWADGYHGLQCIRGGAARIAHKTPSLALYLPELRALWPRCQVLHIVRDPREVIRSYCEADWGPMSVEEGIDWYCRRVGAAVRSGRGADWYCEILFEELAREPARLLALVCKTVGLPYTDCHATAVSRVRPPEAFARSRYCYDATLQRSILDAVRHRIPELDAHCDGWAAT